MMLLKDYVEELAQAFLEDVKLQTRINGELSARIDVLERVVKARGGGQKVNTVLVKRYLHGSDDELSDLWHPDDPRQETYAYALYEVQVDLEVDLDTGKSRIIAIDGIELSKLQDFR